MSDADWDADDFEPDLDKKVAAAVVTTDKWDGEDEDDDVKDSWDKSDNEDSSEGQQKAVQRKKKKKLADIIAEKEAAAEAAAAARAGEEAAAKAANTPEGRALEKLRRLKMEESVNLQMAKDMVGMGGSGSIDNMVPVSKDEFAAFEKALTEKIQIFSSSEHYPDFVESFIKGLCLDQTAATLKKIKMNADALHSTKLKEEKAKSKKKPGAGKGGIKMDLDRDIYTNAGGGGYDDMDDFM